MRNDERSMILIGSSSSNTSISDNNIQYQYQETNNNGDDADHEQSIREIHALTPLPQTRPPSLSTTSSASSENFSTLSREFNALVLAGSTIDHHGSENNGTNSSSNNNNNNSNNINHSVNNNSNNLGRIGEEEAIHGEIYDDNPLAIVADHNPLPSPSRNARIEGGTSSVMAVKKEEVESKISAWQTAKIAKINNRFKREDAMISGWENEEVQKASSWMKKVERKLDEKRAKALEKMQNSIAKARRKTEEKRASAEAKRGTKVAKVMEIANLMRAVGKPPVKRSFF